MRGCGLCYRAVVLAGRGDRCEACCFPAAAIAQAAARPGTLAPLARYFPDTGSRGCTSSSTGSTAIRSRGKKTAAYRLLNETTTGAMYRAALPRIFGLLLREQSDVPLKGRELDANWSCSCFGPGLRWASTARRHGPAASRLRLWSEAVRRAKRRSYSTACCERARTPALRGTRRAKPGGRTVHQLVAAGGGQAVSWWAEGEDLVVSLVSVEAADAVIDVLDGRVQECRASIPRRAGALAQRRCARIRAGGHGLLRHGRASSLAPRGREPGARSDQAIRLSLGFSRRCALFDRERGRAGSAEREFRRSSINRSSTCESCRRFPAASLTSRSSRWTERSSAPGSAQSLAALDSSSRSPGARSPDPTRSRTR